MKHLYFQVVGLAALLTVGCQSLPPGMVERSEGELKAMEELAVQGHELFARQDYSGAAQIFQELAREETVSAPLYQAELATVLLAQGNEAGALQQLRRAQTRCEQLFSAKSERDAASVWSGEINKIFRGEPHERSTMYAILGLIYLNRGEVDNALACFKSGLLHDADTAKGGENSDYALLLYLAGLCHQWQGNAEDAARLRGLAAEAVIRANPEAPLVRGITQQFFFEFYSQKKQIAKLRSNAASRPELAKELTAEADKLEKMTLRQFLRQQAEEYAEDAAKLPPLRQLLQFDDAQLQKMYLNFTRQDFFQTLAQNRYFAKLTQPFNTLLVVWVGNGPSYFRTGDYGEHRMLRCGSTLSDYFQIRLQGKNYPAIRGLGDVNHQAAQRGVRKMDEILQKKAEIRRTTHTAGTVLLATGVGLMYSGDLACSCVGAGLIVAGGITHGIGALMTPEADIRCWKNLPAQFMLIPLQLPTDKPVQGTLTAYWQGQVLAVHPFTIPAGIRGPVRVIQLLPGDLGSAGQSARSHLKRQRDLALWYAASRAPHQTEISVPEMENYRQNLPQSLQEPERKIYHPQDLPALQEAMQKKFETELFKGVPQK